MKEITIPVLWAATEYYLGALLWIGLAGVAAAFVLWIFALRANARIDGAVRRAFQPAIVLAVLAGAGVAASVPSLTRSNWSFVAGATDYAAIIGLGAATAVAVVYVLTPIIMLVKAPPRA
jgi:hypothetical protein